MRICIKRDLCCGAQICVRAAPGLFVLDEYGYNASDGKTVPAGQEAAARRAMGGCPEEAIALVEDVSNSSAG
jgi:ferredoxin